MIRDYIAKYYLEQNCNCAESIFLAANDEYHLGLTAEDAKLVGAFGGGMGCGNACGALCGAMAIIGKVNITSKAHETDGFKENCSSLLAEFEKELGSTMCSELTLKYKKEGTRCLDTVLLAADVLQRHMDGVKEDAVIVTPEQIKAVKAFGFLHEKGTHLFNGRVITRNGKITNRESDCITKAAGLFGNGEIAMTTRLTLEIQGVPYENIQPLRDYLAAEGLETGGTGSKVRPVVSCKGTTCQYGLYDTFALSEEIHNRFYKGYEKVKLPHKFKIATGGCPNNCVKPELNDIGVIGQRVPRLDADLCRGCKKCAVEAVCPIHSAKVVNGILQSGEDCNNCGRCVGKCPFKALENSTYGYKICIGGRWGKKVAQAHMLDRIFTDKEEVLSVIEKALLLFREQGITGERFADTIERIGFDNVQAQLLGDEILERKEEILGASLHLTGGATC